MRCPFLRQRDIQDVSNLERDSKPGTVDRDGNGERRDVGRDVGAVGRGVDVGLDSVRVGHAGGLLRAQDILGRFCVCVCLGQVCILALVSRLQLNIK